VVAVPHVCGVDNPARAPPLKCNNSSENGSCGVLSKTPVSRPVVGSADTLPGTFTSTPDPDNCMNKRIILPSLVSEAVHGSHSGVPTYTGPSNGAGSNGVCTTTVPSSDAFGQD